MKKAQVYFTKEITPKKMIEMYKIIDQELKGNIGVKVHSGEAGNQNYIKPEFYKDIVNYINGTIVECNTAYEGQRNTTKAHLETLKKHGWTKLFKVDLLDASSEIELPINNGKQISTNYVGTNIKNYNSLLVLSHFKGHPMGGFGGALKNISIGLASSHGKANIHGAGNPEKIWSADHDAFIESMADAAKSIVDYMNGQMIFINTMVNMSVDCDCCEIAEDPCMKDIGILSSIDPVALDQACIDLIYQANDPGKNDLIDRIESRNGIHILEAAEQLGVGTREYELIDIDKI